VSQTRKQRGSVNIYINVSRFPITVIMVKNQDDFKNYKDEPLGRTKNLG
jgi:hypothetical protein